MDSVGLPSHNSPFKVPGCCTTFGGRGLGLRLPYQFGTLRVADPHSSSFTDPTWGLHHISECTAQHRRYCEEERGVFSVKIRLSLIRNPLDPLPEVWILHGICQRFMSLLEQLY